MKRSILILVLIMLAVMLAGCAAKPENPTGGVVMGQMASGTQSDLYSWTGSYNPAAEEDDGTPYLPGTVYDDYGNPVNVGATPIPLDPIDMPTATPRPSLSFQYGAISADKLGIAFEAPAGWYVDASASDMIVLTDPNMYDGINATFTIRMQNVSKDYKLANVKDEVRAALKEVGQYNYTEWETTTLSKRTLMDKDGYYANYRGVLFDGTVVRGRVMVALLDGNRIITVHMKAPGWYNESYMNVVAHFRDTLTAR